MQLRKKVNNNKRRKRAGVRRTLDPDLRFEAFYGRRQDPRLNPIGTWRRVHLQYSQTITFTAAAGTFVLQQFRSNSVFDPDLTGAGTQPLEHDQLAALFNRYRVNKFSWYVECPSTTLNYKVVNALVNGNEAPASVDELNEYPSARYRTISFNGAPSAILTGKKLLAPYNGMAERTYHTDDRTGAVVTTNPIEVINYNFGLQNDNGSGITVIVTFKFRFDVIYYDPIIPGRSLLRERALAKKYNESIETDLPLQTPAKPERLCCRFCNAHLP